MLKTYEMKIFEHKQERETIRGLSYAQVLSLQTVLTRHNIDFIYYRIKDITQIMREGGKKNAV